MQEIKSKIGDVSVADRRAQILDAAERSFCRSGFHRATMQDVAAEAGMSPGNLYRYFPSKDALVAGLCERDRLGLSQEFTALGAAGGDFLAAFRALGKKHFEDANAGKARLCLEIWAEATRNPAIAALQADFDRTLEEQLAAAFRARQGGRARSIPRSTRRAVASIVGKLGDGLFVRRAVAADFDPDREVGEVFAVIEALLEGTIAFPAAADGQERQQ